MYIFSECPTLFLYALRVAYCMPTVGPLYALCMPPVCSLLAYFPLPCTPSGFPLALDHDWVYRSKAAPAGPLLALCWPRLPSCAFPGFSSGARGSLCGLPQCLCSGASLGQRDPCVAPSRASGPLWAPSRPSRGSGGRRATQHKGHICFLLFP